MSADDAFSKYIIPDDYRPQDADSLTVDVGNGTASEKSGLKSRIKIPRGANRLLIAEHGEKIVGVYFQEFGADGKFERGHGVSYVEKRLLSKLTGYLQEHGFTEVNG